MKLTILGGAGFRTPLVVGAVAAAPGLISEVCLYDVDATRLDVMERVLRGRLGDSALVLRTSTHLDAALQGASFVFSAIRVGGLKGRVIDERVALDLGVLGQETTGPGGIAYGLRTIPVALAIAHRVAAVAPDAWFINFTNPAGMITQALQQVLGERVIGICDSPIGLARRVARVLGVTGDYGIGYSGLNHLGWLRSLTVDGVDVLPRLLADPALLAATEEGRLFGADWLQDIGCIPNEYLYYYSFNREAVAAIRAAEQTRGEFLLAQQQAFYDRAATTGAGGQAALWDAVRREREETYLAEAREEGEEREKEDLSGGYEGVALDLMTALTTGTPTTCILNVRNGTTLPGLPADAVVEVPARVTTGAITVPPAVAPGAADLGLMQQIKAVDELTIRAAVTRSPSVAWRAFAAHPLVDSVSVARELLEGYSLRHPELGDMDTSRSIG